MEKNITALSTSFRYLRLVLPPLLGLFYVVVAVNSLCAPKTLTTADWVGLLIGPVAIWLLYRLFSSSFATGYDAEYLYLYKRTGTQQISLGSVYKIKYTMTELNKNHYWKIGYRDSQNQEHSVRVLPVRVGLFGSSIKGFIAAVEQKNPQVVVTNWSHSFDFDQ